MRKTLLVIAVLFTTVQVFAATVTLSVDDEGGGWAAIRYSADANVSAFGLKVTADSGAIFTDINDYNVGECTASVQGYGIFPGTIDINEDTGVVEADGTPIAPSWDPCDHVGPTGLNTNTLILEMGALYVEGNEPAQSGTLITVQVDGGCNVCVDGEPIRGNVVLTDGTALDPDEACAYIQVDCFYVGLVDKCGHTVTQADVDLWVAKGEPISWCYDCHCKGDTDDSCGIDSDDVMAFLAGWSSYDPACDTDYSGGIDSDDIMNLIDGWNNGCGDCTPLP